MITARSSATVRACCNETVDIVDPRDGVSSTGFRGPDGG